MKKIASKGSILGGIQHVGLLLRKFVELNVSYLISQISNYRKPYTRGTTL